MNSLSRPTRILIAICALGLLLSSVESVAHEVEITRFRGPIHGDELTISRGCEGDCGHDHHAVHQCSACTLCKLKTCAARGTVAAYALAVSGDDRLTPVHGSDKHVRLRPDRSPGSPRAPPELS